MSDALDPYLPALADIPLPMVAAARARLVAFYAQAWPTLDTRPNTPVGDFLVTPGAYREAALALALSRMQSDLQLENVAAGVVWNCAFVQAYLQNFGVLNTPAIQAWGVVQITFGDGGSRQLDRRARFMFGDTTNVFGLRLFNPGPFYIRESLADCVPGTNEVVICQMADGLWAANLPVVGFMASAVLAGQTATTDQLLPDTLTISAAFDFQQGNAAPTIQQAAQAVTSKFSSSSLTSRRSAVQFLEDYFPGVQDAAVLVTGDRPELIRDTLNAAGLPAGVCDVLVRGTSVYPTAQITVPFTLVGNVYIAPISAPNPIMQVTGVANPNVTSPIVYTVYTQSLNDSVAPGLSAAYSNLEQLWLVIDQPTDPTFSAEATVEFTFTVAIDPAVTVVALACQGPEYAPAGVNVLVRGLTPIYISSFVVSYGIQPGRSLSLDIAQSEISTYLNALAYPQVYSDAMIGDTVLYANGRAVLNVAVQAVVWLSAASMVMPQSANLITGYSAAIAAAVPVPKISIVDSNGLANVSYRDPNLGTSAANYGAVGPRSITYVVEPDAIDFSEVF